MTHVAPRTIDGVERVVHDCFEARESESVETAINGWPTIAAIAAFTDPVSKSQVENAIQELADEGRVVAKSSRVDLRGRGDVKTVAPAAEVRS